MQKISASLRNTIRSLATSKGRRETGWFMTERTKNVHDLLGSKFNLRYLVATSAWFENHSDLISGDAICLLATSSDMERLTTLNTPPDVIAVFDKPASERTSSLDTIVSSAKDNLILACDNVQDPGNMGTIIRLADWFGVRTILAGEGTVDIYNPKVVISSMGSIGRVEVMPCRLGDVLSQASRTKVNIWGTFLNGTNIYETVSSRNATGIVVMGNEGRGISDDVAKYISHRISIPCYNPSSDHAESLNVAMATAITLAEFRRVTNQ